ncbi:hypothetical protein Tco_0775105 [Tanacetum coccineum]
MTTLKFADTHNMVVFLSKPIESDGFEQIVDFLNAHPIKYALTVNSTIYTSGLLSRRDLQLANEESVDCLPNSTIFEQITLMGYEKCLSPKTTAWNKFSSTMASAIICLPTNQKFNFSKFIFESMIRNLDNLSGEGSVIPTDPHHTPTFIQPCPQPQKTQKPRKPKRKDTQVPQPSDSSENVADEAIHKELCGSLVRAVTTASSLEAEQDSGNISKTQSKATPSESSSLGTTSSGGLKCQENIGDTIVQARRVKKFEKKNRSRTHRLKKLYKVGLTARVESSGNEESLGEDASKQGRIDAIDADEEITLVSVQNVDEEMFDVNVLDGEEVFVAEQEVAANKENDEVNVVKEVVEVISVAANVVSTAGAATTVSAATTTTDDDGDITLAQALIEMKSTKPKNKGVVIQELGESTTTISSQLSSQQSQDKGKGILIEPVKPMKKKDLIRLDEEAALKLQAEFDEEERLAREKAKKEKEANIALIETWDDIQAKIDADHQLAERLQAQEQEELSVEEKATLFQQLLEKRRKHFAAKRAEEKRNKPPTKAQQRKIMCTYLKNMEGYKLKDLKLKEFDSIQEMFDRAFKRVNTFEDFRTELVEGKEKRAGEELIQESSKKQKVDDDKETTELKQCMEIIPDEEEVTINAIPLAVKSPRIVDWKIHKEGKKSYYQIIRADGKSQMYRIFSQMLKSFDREDLEDLYKLVKARYGSTRPVESMDYLLWNDMKIMFEPHVEDEVWKLQNGYKVLE